MKPDFLEDLAPVVRSQLKAWMAELKVLSRDPRVRKFAELRQKIETADAWYRLGSPGQGEIGGDEAALGGPAEELAGVQTACLEDPLLRIPPTRAEGGMGRVPKEFSFAALAPACEWK